MLTLLEVSTFKGISAVSACLNTASVFPVEHLLGPVVILNI